ncbi:MAG: hypothetical protein IT364_27180 [Candidatus Hydrogenedentes bacterium]|nr:hypothetical protein [Candidatus Hydrogenedentota bacterium]
MDYARTVPVTADGRKILEQARNVFIQQGFEVSPVSAQRFEAKGEKLLRNNHNPFHGVSRAIFMVSGGMLTVEAEFGGVRRLRNFLFIFPPALGVVLAVTFSLMGNFAGKPWYMPFLPIAPVAPWVVISPLMASSFRRKVIGTLDTLLENLHGMRAD